MRAHAEAVRDRLKLLLLLVDAVPLPPPPRLVHKRPMRRVHQTDDAVVHAAGQVGLKMRDAVAPAELRQLTPRSGFGDLFETK